MWSNQATAADYNTIEKELIESLEAKFNTAPNAQEADIIALKEVKAIYEHIIKAINYRYSVVVEFQ